MFEILFNHTSHISNPILCLLQKLGSWINFSWNVFYFILMCKFLCFLTTQKTIFEKAWFQSSWFWNLILKATWLEMKRKYLIKFWWIAISWLFAYFWFQSVQLMELSFKCPFFNNIQLHPVLLETKSLRLTGYQQRNRSKMSHQLVPRSW